MGDRVELLLEEIRAQLVELNTTMTRIKLGVVDGAENQMPVQIRDEIRSLRGAVSNIAILLREKNVMVSKGEG